MLPVKVAVTSSLDILTSPDRPRTERMRFLAAALPCRGQFRTVLVLPLMIIRKSGDLTGGSLQNTAVMKIETQIKQADYDRQQDGHQKCRLDCKAGWLYV